MISLLRAPWDPAPAPPPEHPRPVTDHRPVVQTAFRPQHVERAKPKIDANPLSEIAYALAMSAQARRDAPYVAKHCPPLRGGGQFTQGRPTARDRAAAALTDTPQTAAEISAVTGMNAKDASTTLSHMQRRGETRRTVVGCLWGYARVVAAE